MESLNTERLEKQLDVLITRYQALRDENRRLRSSHSTLQDDKVKLKEKNDLATNKIEAMIGRLKDMEPKND